ncbi:hypothetical protein DFH08DRAFT_849653 [Mycena albidolilacea]|uniref:LYC1 C-terminal domain-containing protein n=1 Tax=Mycena albidolilacea TaxID=1033008 RepID=A0AAD7AEG7_9AGAR|nr:hypothetical protein DFH08DRAFT_849653 [Mycena albidolilacea]
MTTTDLSTLSLFSATPEQIAEARRRTHNEWGKGLTLEEHLARYAGEDHLEGSRDGRFKTWVLAPRNDPHTLHFKCACETFKRTGLLVKNKAAESVTCYGIASVFTPPENRGQGFARHMMRLLHWVIADEALLPSSGFPAVWGAPPPKVEGARNGRFSALWSDVGQLYNSCGPAPDREGWVTQGTATTVWEVEASPLFETTAPDWTWLDDAGVSALWEEDAEKIRSEMENSEHPGTSFAFLPNRGVASYQHRRLAIYFQRLATPPQTWGVASPDRSAYATWTIDPRHVPITLTVSRIRTDPQSFRDLVGKLLEVARKHDVKRVEMWNLPSELELLAGTLGATNYSRDLDHLPSFKIYGPESEAEMSWAFNERFCWC